MKNIQKQLALLLALVMAFAMSIGVMAYDVTAETKSLDDVAASLSGKTVILHSNDVHGAIDGYEAIFDGKPFLCRDKRLDKSEREFVSFYVNSLGRYDAVGQTEFHSSAEKKIDVFLSTASETAKRYSALSVKLAFCLGVSLFILII